MNESSYKGSTAVRGRAYHEDENGKQATNRSEERNKTTSLVNKGTLEKIRNFRIDFGPSKKDILNFTNQLAVMVRAGISLPDTLESIANQLDNEKFKSTVMGIKRKIESGESFSQALGSYPEIFGNLYINMVAAAEISGALSDMLGKLVEYLGRDNETRAEVKGAMVYPMIIAFMAISTTVFLLCFVLPKFGGIFEGKEHLLPTPTKLLMGSSLFIRSYWFLILPGIAGVIWGFLYFIGTKVGRNWWDKVKLVVPIIRKLCRSLYITRSLHTMGVLTHAGVPILDTIAITAQVSGNVHFEKMWRGVYEDVRRGGKIALSLGQYDLMPKNVVQMIRSGEDSGTLSSVLGDVSEYYNKELKTIIKMVTSMIEPIMIVLMGVLVGFIAMSIMLPIFQMSNLVTGK